MSPGGGAPFGWGSGFPSQPIRIGYVRIGGSLRGVRTLSSSGLERPGYVGFPPGFLLDGMSGGSVPRSGWVHLRSARPPQKLGRREPEFPPEFPRSSQRLTRLEVT